MAVSALGGWSPVKLVVLTPLWFGIGGSVVVSCMRACPELLTCFLSLDQPTAHVHHAWETYVAGGRTRQALLRGTLQSSAFKSCLLPFRLDVENLTRATTRDSLSIRLHHHLWMVRRIPVPPNR